MSYRTKTFFVGTHINETGTLLYACFLITIVISTIPCSLND